MLKAYTLAPGDVTFQDTGHVSQFPANEQFIWNSAGYIFSFAVLNGFKIVFLYLFV